ncbi:hypothetical protein, partial [Treponema endosymbiont of Eucomonympha sp.]|uniref:hypothetical protein n=1 Tax=Treponema endosymbiont of Eucomonympha sp. TaxID=1580831 RepID=UPI000AF63D21
TSRDAGTGIEKKSSLSGEMDTRTELLSRINSLGNCALLLRSHNRSKGKEQLYDCLSDIYNPQQIELLKNALLLTDNCVMPNNASIEQIVKEINNRTGKIKTDLIDFFDNTDKKRKDVT